MNNLFGQSVGLNDAIYLNMHENVITEHECLQIKYKLIFFMIETDID